MYIISVMDNGQERTFKTWTLMMTNAEIFFIARDEQYRFCPSDLIGVIHVSGRRVEVSVGLEDDGVAKP